jgi:polysaccharide export outer membrane protein
MTRSGVTILRGFTAALVATFLMTACGGRPPARGLEALEPPGERGVRPGDVVEIEFWRQPDLSGEHGVDRDGRVYLPLVRGIEVQGLTAEQIRERLTDLYAQFYDDPLVVARVKLGVNVTGAVGGPGRYTVDPAFTLFDALGLAGGIQSDGKRSAVELVREGERYVVDLDEALVASHAESLRLQSGDWIYVPRRFWTLQRISTYGTVAVLILQIVDFATR